MAAGTNSGKQGRSTHVSTSVKEARDRLGQKMGRKRFEYELLLMFAKNELSSSLSIPLFAVILAVSSSLWAPREYVTIWIASVFITKGIILALCRQFAQLERREIDVKHWHTKLLFAEFFYGLAWAGIALISTHTNDQAAHVFIYAAVIAVVSIRMMFASTVMPLVIIGTAPMTAALVVHYLLLPNPFYWAMAAMAVGVHAYLIFLMTGLNSTVYNMLDYRTEKELLIGKLEEEKAFSDDARKRAEEANLAKSRFLATMSHELRTPLNAILGFSEVMKAEIFGKHSNPTYKEYSEDIHDSGQHLLNLINEILDLSRIEAERYELNESAINLADIVDDCQRLLSVRARNKGIELLTEINDNLPSLWADERAIRQICLNVLSNAVKFTPQSGRVIVKTGESANGGQYLIIRDTGPGIPEDEVEKVLKPFGQGSLAHETAEGGTGLGLPIVQKLISLHGGTFQLRSQLRRGTEVKITLPAKRVMQALPPLPAEEEQEKFWGELSPLDKNSKEFEELTAQVQKIIRERQLNRNMVIREAGKSEDNQPIENADGRDEDESEEISDDDQQEQLKSA